MAWTYKVLTDNEAGKASWHIAKMRFDTPAEAATGAAAYLRCEAERGNLMLVALEPMEDDSPLAEQNRILIEHNRELVKQNRQMLEGLKILFSARDGGSGRIDMWELIHKIDPDWANPWRDTDDPEGRCSCPLYGINVRCPIHGFGDGELEITTRSDGAVVIGSKHPTNPRYVRDSRCTCPIAGLDHQDCPIHGDKDEHG